MAAPDPTAIDPALVMSVIAGSFPGDLGVEVLEVGRDRAVGRLLADARHLHPGGFVHGGVWTAFADTVAAWGTIANLSPGWDFTTVEMKTNVFAAGRAGDELIATGEPLHRGRRTQAWEVRIHRGERLVAVFVCTQMLLEPREG